MMKRLGSGQRSVDGPQAWFWSPRWQQMEREADDDFAAGRMETFDDVDSFFADLDACARARYSEADAPAPE